MTAEIKIGWTTPTAIKYLKARLGFPARAVELDKDMFEAALMAAVTEISSYIPNFKYANMNVLLGQSGYDFKQMNLPYGKGITQVFDQPITSPSAVFNEFEYYRLRQPPYVDMSELLIDRMYYKEIGLLTGTNFDWMWDGSSAKLLLTPKPTRTRRISYEYNAIPAGIEEIKAVNQNWVIKYSLAVCKEMLGRVRGKFGGVPGNELPLNMDADKLLDEARSEMDKLEEDLAKKAAAWTAPIKG